MLEPSAMFDQFVHSANPEHSDLHRSQIAERKDKRDLEGTLGLDGSPNAKFDIEKIGVINMSIYTIKTIVTIILRFR